MRPEEPPPPSSKLRLNDSTGLRAQVLVLVGRAGPLSRL